MQALWPIDAANAAITITVKNEQSTLDETATLQTPATTDTGNDFPVADLPTDFKTLLGQLGVSIAGGSYAATVGVSATSMEFIDVASDAPLDTLGFTDSNGNPFDGAIAPNVKTLGGGNVHLFSSANSPLLIGRRPSNGPVVFAVYMHEVTDSDGSTDIQLWTVTNEPLAHPTFPNPDDRVDILQGVFVTATAALVFDFNDLPSGQNLFGIVGPSENDPAIAVFGRLTDLKPDNTYTNVSDTINTSKGGGPTTIGVNNQLFDTPDEGAYFTYIDKPVQSFLAGAPGGLSQGEADDADNIQYNGGLVEVDRASFLISQLQGGGTASVRISAFDLDDAPQGPALLAASGTNPVSIKAVRVFDVDGVTVLEEETAGGQQPEDDPNIDITFAAGVATVTGLEAGFLVEFDTGPDLHDQALIQRVAGKFDIGAYGINRADDDAEPLTNRLFVDDDGPRLDDILNSLVAFVAGATTNKPVTGDVGTDAPGTFSIESFSPAPKINLVQLSVVKIGTTVIYYQELNGNNTFNDGVDQKYFQLSLAPIDTVLNYIFTVFVTPVAPPLIFDFNALPSGQNLFGMVGAGEDLPALVIIGAVPIVDVNGKYTNASDTINTSKGGGPTTIGVNNQMFDPEEGAYFTYVDGPDPRFLAGVSGGLDQNEADDVDNILYDGGLVPVDSASFRISQLQGGGTATAKITAFTLADDYQGRDLANNLGDVGGNDIAPITKIRVYNASGTLIEETGGVNSPAIGVTFAGGSAEVSGLGAGFRVEWVTSPDHHQALVEGKGGKFDIGQFTINEPQDTPDQRLEFTVRLTDRDSDWVEKTFAVCLDGDGSGGACV